MESMYTPDDWSGPSLENRMFSPSWGFESTIRSGQPFQGSLLPTTTGNSHTVHHYAFRQTWHHSVPLQNYSGYNPYCSDVWYGDNPLIEGFGNVEVGSDINDEDAKVTSSTEVSPWKPHLALLPVSEVLNTSYGNLKWQNGSISPVEGVLGGETCQLRFQPSKTPVKPEKSKKRTEVPTQTPWELKKNKSALEGKTQNKRKRKPQTLQRKSMQKERERKIRTELQHPSTMLPCSNLNNSRLSKKEIPESTISHIKQLPENSRKAYLQKGLKTGGLRVSLQDNNALSLSQSSFGVADQQNDTALKSSEDSSSPCSTPEITIDETLPACSFSPISEPISELSCHGSVEREESSTKPLQCGNNETPVNHIKRPMNAFLLYSQQYRWIFNALHPGRNNREISTILGKHWREMKPEQKEPYKEKARELRTKELHSDFKYCEARREMGLGTASADGNK